MIFYYTNLCSTENTIQLKEILRIIALTILNKEAILKKTFGAPSAEKRKPIIGLISRMAN